MLAAVLMKYIAMASMLAAAAQMKCYRKKFKQMDITDNMLQCHEANVNGLTQKGLQLVGEYYSVPRVVPAVCKLVCSVGLCLQGGFRKKIGNPSLSLDLCNGWDFKKACNQKLSLRLLNLLPVLFLILSPPCTAFSSLNHLWNYPKLDRQEKERRLAVGRAFVTHAMQCARVQWEEGRYFLYEHPATASSWQLGEVKAVEALPGVKCVVFDQCMTGLKSKVGKFHMCKRTRLMTNSKFILEKFQGLMCDDSHEHCRIQGTDAVTVAVAVNFCKVLLSF